MSNKGVLLVLMQPPATLEEEFNAWYDTEHVPERLAVPGFETGLRFVCISGWPRYLAVYDLTKPEVLDSPDYARVSGDNFSPWTRRVTSRVRVCRSAGMQVYPGNAVTPKTTARMLLLRFQSLRESDGPQVVAGMRRLFEEDASTIQLRVFACSAADGMDYYGAVDARGPVAERIDTAVFGRLADAINLINVYAAY